MWRSIADWALAFFGMARELQEHRANIRELEGRVRDLEEALKLVTQDQRHTREMDASEREKLMLQIENALEEQRADIARAAPEEVGSLQPVELHSVFFCALAMSLHAAFAGGEEAGLQRFAFEKAEMGLPFRITLFAADEATAKEAADAAFARVAELNGVLSDYDPDSELSRLSRTAGSGMAVPVSADLWRVLERGQALAARTDGAFDLTVGPLVNVWRRARRKQELPSPELIAEMRGRVGFRNLKLDAEKRTAELQIAEMRLDAGSIGKVYAVDAALAVLKQRGLTRALVAGSGDMAAGDAPPGLPGWRIEVAALDAPGAPPPRMLHLANCGIATSGDVFQRVEIGGKRYSHIVDPRTGLGLTDHSLVTVIAPDCFTANGFTTSASVLGPERGLKLIDDTPGVAALLVRKPGETIEFIESRAWKTRQNEQ